MASCHTHWIAGPPLPEHRLDSVGISRDGMLANHIMLHENAIVHLPDSMLFVEAACLPCTAVTTWTSLNRSTSLQPCQTVLVQGTGGVALFALNVARMFGARLFAITSMDKKARKLKELGADAVVNYGIRQLEARNPRSDQRQGRGQGDRHCRGEDDREVGGGDIAVVGFTSGFGGGLPPIDILGGPSTWAAPPLAPGQTSKPWSQPWLSTRSRQSSTVCSPLPSTKMHIAASRAASMSGKLSSRSASS